MRVVYMWEAIADSAGRQAIKAVAALRAEDGEAPEEHCYAVVIGCRILIQLGLNVEHIDDIRNTLGYISSPIDDIVIPPKPEDN